MRSCSALFLALVLIASLSIIYPSNAIHADIDYGVGFSLSLDYGTASIEFSNGSSIDVGRIEGDAVYQRTMRAPELMHPPSNETEHRLLDLRYQETQPGGNNAWSFYAASLERMLVRLVNATESRLGQPIFAAGIVLPFSTIIAPIPARWINLLDDVSTSLGLKAPLSGQQAAGNLALHAYGLDERCPRGFADGKAQLILTIDYSRAALTVLFIEATCEYLETNYDLHEPRLGAAALAELPDGRAHLARALRNLTSLPFMPRENYFTKRKISWGPADIDEIVLSGELAGSIQLQEVLDEVLGKHFTRLINITRADIVDPLFAVSRGTARDCLERKNAKPRGCPNLEELPYERDGPFFP
ncbi:MAG: hypothetical protein Q9207_007000 [Kuettlingeria erythrocarpa]